MKKIPYGIGNFEKIKTENYYFIDKTKFIEKLESLGSNYLFLFRPRRFGKSLFLSMLEHYYDIRRKEQFEELFSDTYIRKNPTKLRGSFPILKFNFSGIPVSGGLKDAERSFDLSIKRTIRTFFSIYKEDYPEIKDIQERVLELEKAGDILSEFIQNLYELKIKYYLLIDEYDNFANNILIEYGKGDYRAVTHGGGFLRSFFAVIKNGTENRTIERLFITGVTPLVLSDITSGMNIGDNISVYPMFEDIVGFNREEVEELVEYYVSEGGIKREDKDKVLGVLNEYANNYFFSKKMGKSVHNSDMVMYIIKNYFQFGEIADEPIDANVRTDFGKLRFLVVESNRLNGNFNILEEVLDKGKTSGRLVDIFSLDELRTRENFRPFLYYLGLLTIGEYYEGGEYQYKIPNTTVRTLLWEYLRKSLEKVYELRIDVDILRKYFREMAFEGKWRELFEYLFEEFYGIVASVRDFIWREEGVSMFVKTYLSMSSLYVPEFEYEARGGYVDIYLRKHWIITENTKYEYIIEMKHLKMEGRKEIPEDELERVKGEAIEQIIRYAKSKKMEVPEYADRSKVPEIKKIVIITSSRGVLWMGEIS